MKEQYSDAVLGRYYEPSYCGVIDEDAVGVVTGFAGTQESGEVVRIQMKLDANSVITTIRFKAQGCCATVAAAQWVCEHLDQQPLVILEQLSADQIIDELQIPRVKIHSVMLALQAARLAVQSVR